MKNADFYAKITNELVKQIKENNCLPWVRGYKKGTGGTSYGNFEMPYNATTGRNYTGGNIMCLWLFGRDYNEPAWLTYKQLEAIGGNVIKGQKGAHIQFFTTYQKEKETSTGDKKMVKGATLKNYCVFNIEQCENYDAEKLAINSHKFKPAIDPQGAAFDFAASCGAKVDHSRDYKTPCYMPSRHLIGMPNYDDFKTPNHYGATLMHELTHWTGHSSELDRGLDQQIGYDRSEYAKEELIAELGSAFLSHDLGISLEEPRHAAYLQSWIKALNDDHQLIFQAASAAQKAVNYLHELSEAKQEQAA